jgi:predicted HNH restriction endonuclease
MTRITGKSIAKQHGINVKYAPYRETGDWYHIINEFPAALFDANGYILFNKREEYDLFLQDNKDQGVYENKETNTLTIRNRISSHSAYTPFAINAPFLDDDADFVNVIEGAKCQITVNFYEREPKARNICIKKWGTNCSVCNINFGRDYGDIGNGFIHVHHLIPISSIKKEYKLNPEKDMRPVCPNCHAMLHRRNPPFSIDELIKRRSTLSRK